MGKHSATPKIPDASGKFRASGNPAPPAANIVPLAGAARSRTIVVERITYTVFAIEGGRRLKTWARIGPKLKSVTAVSESALRAKLRKISVDLLNGETEAAALQPGDHREHLACLDELRPYRIGLFPAVKEYAEIRRLLGDASPLEAVRFYQQHHGALVRFTVAGVIDAFLPRLAKLSEAYRTAFTYDLKRLRDQHGSRPIGDVTTLELTQFIDATGNTKSGTFRAASDWRRKQVRGELVTLWRYAQRILQALPALPTAASRLEKIETINEARLVWDPEHLRRALEIAAAESRAWLPWLALSALANVRSKPIRRLDWADVHWLDRLIELPARSSKVKKRVTLKISPALETWLDPERRARGPLCPLKRLDAFCDRLRRHDLPYYQNVIRRSYITYLLALTDDEEMVARAANTSVEKLRANYRQIRTYADRLVTPDLAAQWFATERRLPLNHVQLDLLRSDTQGTNDGPRPHVSARSNTAFLPPVNPAQQRTPRVIARQRAAAKPTE